MKALLFVLATVLPSITLAANFYVMDTVPEEGASKDDARVATRLIKNAVSNRPSDQLVEDEFRADYILQPRLMRLGESLILTVEKNRGEETLFAAQTKVSSVENLDRAARNAAFAAIDEPSLERMPQRRSIASENVESNVPYRVEPARPQRIIVVPPASEPQAAILEPSSSGQTSSVPIIDVMPRRKVSYWTAGIGPMIGRQLETDSVFYNFALGHVWDINPRASVKAIGEASFSSGNDGARFFNIGAGGNYFFPTRDYSNGPFVTADIGYGFAEDRSDDEAEGFSFGTGVGYQFFRDTETTLDLLLRYQTIFDQVDANSSNPSLVGVRMAVNF